MAVNGNIRFPAPTTSAQRTKDAQRIAGTLVATQPNASVQNVLAAPAPKPR